MLHGLRRTATYRVQLTPDFTLFDATAIVDYLADLGVSHVYCSPFLQAAAASTHGYDIVDHARVNEELGGEAGFQALVEATRAARLGLLIDIVPNHMAIGTPANRQWWDVLAKGRVSACARWFDIDWDAGDGKVLMAILGDRAHRVLANGEIEVVVELGADGSKATMLAYHDHRLPLSPASLASRHLDDDVERGKVNGDAEGLADLLGEQHYRLTFWQNAAMELNYRRFFDVTTLAGLRVEDPAVFDAVHQRIIPWVRDGAVDGLRIDHPDGLRDPAGYLARLRAELPDTWTLIEKILEPGEELPVEWACEGTTGYDFMRLATGVFVAPAAEPSPGAPTTGTRHPYEQILASSKRMIVRDILPADVARVTRLAATVAAADRRSADFTFAEVHAAIVAMLVEFPVYRTYVTDGAAGGAVASEHDLAVLAGVCQRIVEAHHVDADLGVALIDVLGGVRADEAAVELRARFQQLTGPVMAKSVEDTAFYRYVPLVSLNEVGSDPSHFGVSIDEFHTWCEATAAAWPATMLATSTHDTKRSEDVRVRIDLLSEMHLAWQQKLSSWLSMNAAKWGDRRRDVGMECLLYEVLVGAYPLSLERAQTYMSKASREAKVRTSWLDSDPDYEDALAGFVEQLYADDEFQASLGELCAELLLPGRIASLAQLTLKLTAPGIPDIYKGCEVWTDSLVDPDNRRPVDYAMRRAMLAALGDELPPLSDDSGAAKMWLTTRLLAVRRSTPDAFEGGTYRRLTVEGDRRESTLAYVRGEDVAVVVSTRPLAHGELGWGDTTVELPPSGWRNVIGDRSATGVVGLADQASTYGCAVFVRETLV